MAIGNFIFSIFSGQPLIILGATGPTVIFEKIIFYICNRPDVNLPFLEFRFWIGLWTALFITVLVGLNSSAIMRLFTRFTGEIFSVLISLVFMYEAILALVYIHQRFPYNKWLLRPTIRRQCDCYGFPDLESYEKTNLTNATRLGSYWDNPESSCSLSMLRKFVGTACPGNLFSNHDVFLMSVILFFGTFLVCFYLKKFRNSKFFRAIVSCVKLQCTIEQLLLYIVVILPDTGGTQCMVKCPQYNYFVFCCHPEPLLHPSDTTTLLVTSYLLIKIWLPGNKSQERGGGVRGVEQWIQMTTDYNYYLHFGIQSNVLL